MSRFPCTDPGTGDVAPGSGPETRAMVYPPWVYGLATGTTAYRIHTFGVSDGSSGQWVLVYGSVGTGPLGTGPLVLVHWAIYHWSTGPFDH